MDFKITSATLCVLLVIFVIHRFTYSAFSLAKRGQVYKYDWELWQQYFTWLPGKILCIFFLVLILLLIIESVYFIFFKRRM